MSDDHTTETPDATRRSVLTGAAAIGAAGLPMTGTARAQESEGGGRFADQVVLITGATSGIGRAAAEMFAAEGATVVFNGRRADLGAEVETAIREAGGNATYVQSDVRELDQLKSFIDGVVSEHGRIDVAFNNAGIAIPPGPIEEVDSEQYRDIMATNVDGPFWSMAYELQHMKPAGRGVIVNTSSVFGPHAADGQAAYGATRSAVDAMIEAVAKEAGGAGVRVVGVAPGAVPDTDLFRFMGRAFNDDERAYMGTLAGLGRPGTPEEIAAMVLFLASDGGSFTHGTTFTVDGQFLNA